MKKILKSSFFLLLFVPLSLLLLSSCKPKVHEPATLYNGHWFATNAKNDELDINITKKKITIKDSDGKITFEQAYKETKSGTINGNKYYYLKGKEVFSFSYPTPKNKKQAILLIPDKSSNPLVGKVKYVLSRKEYPIYSDYKSY